jgi:hypothetical protein
MIVFKISIARIVIIVLFLKIMLIIDFNDFFIPQFFLNSFRPSPKLPRHTCRPFTAYRLKVAALDSHLKGVLSQNPSWGSGCPDRYFASFLSPSGQIPG